jgi:hypothetical protein
MSSKGGVHAPIDEIESEPLLSRTDNTSSKLSSTSDHPPPSSTSTGIRPNVESSYHPVYPRTGSSQYVIGRIARNKKASVAAGHTGVIRTTGADATGSNPDYSGRYTRTRDI